MSSAHAPSAACMHTSAKRLPPCSNASMLARTAAICANCDTVSRVCSAGSVTYTMNSRALDSNFSFTSY